MVEPVEPDPEVGTTDDDLANALAAELELALLRTGTLRVVSELPQRPERESLPIDVLADQLAKAVDDSGHVADARGQLEQQLRLRQREVAAFSEWASTVESVGTAEALTELEDARSEFADVLNDNSDLVRALAAENDPGVASPTHSPEHLEVELRMAPAPRSEPILYLPPPGDTTTKNTPVAPVQLDASGAVRQSVLHELVEPAPPAAIELNAIAGIADSVPVVEPATASWTIETHVQQDEPDDLDDIGDTDRAVPGLSRPFPVTPGGEVSVPESFRGAEPSDAAVPSNGAVPSNSAVPSNGAGPPDTVLPFTAPNPISGLTTSLAGHRLDQNAAVLVGESPSTMSALSIEESGIRPTPKDQRVGRAARMFWLWFAVNSSVVSVVLGGVLLSLGMSLRQAIVATLAGIAVSCVPLGVGTLAGKLSGQPTMVVSRASFGHFGNILPASLALLTRVFLGGVLLWFLAVGITRILLEAQLQGPFAVTQLTILTFAVGFLLALVIAIFGYGLIARVQLLVSVISAIALIGLIFVTWPVVNFAAALMIGDGPWILVLTGAVLVFSFVGLAWAMSSADLARYQSPGSSVGTSMLWTAFGAALPAFLLIAYGALLAASNRAVAIGFLERPFETVALLVPAWFLVPLIVALGLSLLSGVVVSIYSGGFSLQALGVPVRRPIAVVVVSVMVAVVTILLIVSVGDFTLVVRDVATTLAVPVAAWVGIFASEMMIRVRRFDSRSLLARGGNYADFRWANVGAFLVISVIGFGLTTASVTWLTWQGYLFWMFGVRADSELGSTDLGVLVALLLGILTPLVAGIPAIRRQERPNPVGN